MRVFIRKYYPTNNVAKVYLNEVKTIVISAGKELVSGDDTQNFLEVMYHNNTGVHKISDVLDVEVV